MKESILFSSVLHNSHVNENINESYFFRSYHYNGLYDLKQCYGFCPSSCVKTKTICFGDRISFRPETKSKVDTCTAGPDY